MQQSEIFATSHFLTPASDLFSFSDAAMHWDCYVKWEHQARFARLHFETRRAWAPQNKYWGTALVTDDVLATLNPDLYVGEADVMLARTGSGIRVNLYDWEEWLAGSWFESCSHEMEREAVGDILPLLRKEIPTVRSLLAASGMASGTQSIDSEARSILAHFACAKLAARADEKGIACPGCKTFSNDYEYVPQEVVDPKSADTSHLVCRACGRKFGPLDM